MTLSLPLDAQDLESILHVAFVADDEAQTGTLLGAVGVIESRIDGDVLLLGGGDGNDFHAVPLSVSRASSMLEAVVDEQHQQRFAPARPEFVTPEAWKAMDDRARDTAAKAAARPDSVPIEEWSRMDDLSRTKAAMTDEFDALVAKTQSYSPLAGVTRADMDVLARLVVELAPDELERIVRRGMAAEGNFG